MIKVIYLFKRKPGMTHEAFRDYYENNHLKIFEKSLGSPDLGKYLVRHVRRYLTPAEDRMSGITRYGFDAILELWFRNREAYDMFFTNPIDPEFQRVVVEDEEKFFDRDHIQCYVVDECDLNIPAV